MFITINNNILKSDICMIFKNTYNNKLYLNLLNLKTFDLNIWHLFEMGIQIYYRRHIHSDDFSRGCKRVSPLHASLRAIPSQRGLAETG